MAVPFVSVCLCAGTSGLEVVVWGTDKRETTGLAREKSELRFMMDLYGSVLRCALVALELESDIVGSARAATERVRFNATWSSDDEVRH